LASRIRKIAPKIENIALRPNEMASDRRLLAEFSKKRMDSVT